MTARPRRVLLVVIGLLVVAAGAGYWWQRPLLLTGTGYAAHNGCALAAVSARAHPEADLPPNPLVPVLRTSVEQGSATSSILGVLSRQTAWASPGFGCTLAGARPALPPPTPVAAAGNPYAATVAPDPAPGVRDALNHAFGTDLPAAERAELGTRAVVVLKDGKLVAERYADGFGPATPQLGWSMAKSVTDLLVGRLVQQGRLSLDDDHLRPEWAGDARARITVRQLLQMTSGLAWDETYALGTPITRMLYLEPDMGAYVAAQPLGHDPGTYLQYSSGSTTLLCSVLAARTGLGANLPRDLLFAPLGLTSAVLEPDAAGTPVCSSYLWATPRDWAALGQFALNDGVWNGERLLPAGWLADSTRAVAVTSAELDPYASGWWPNRGPDGSVDDPRLPADSYFAKGHDGQWVIVVPSERLVVVRLGFTPSRDDTRAVSATQQLVAALRR
ncbi:serine hydrolase domain-containing protein [Pseudonocardia sp. CA-107938]|uniref:serine hydrolase domain-containing protein n=1 Tax=Pseudonocardia sp. CA-107938 TaxID=3240021 RepID=UPI003D8F89B3